MMLLLSFFGGSFVVLLRTISCFLYAVGNLFSDAFDGLSIIYLGSCNKSTISDFFFNELLILF